MDDISIGTLSTALFVLILLSAFFSSSETGMMSLNRYRLRHLVNNGHKSATKASMLLSRTDRLIGVILIGNNLVNVLAAQIAGVIGMKLYGDFGLWAAGGVLTLMLLIFAEVTPKTIAATYPERIAFPAGHVLVPLLWIMYPFVALVNIISNSLLRLIGINPDERARLTDHLHPDELRTVVDEAGDLIPDQHQGMLLNVLDLEKATVEDIMVPRSDVIGIDLEDSIEDILDQLRSADHTRLPVFEGDINNLVGLLHIRNAAKFLVKNDSDITLEDIRTHMYKPYFVPESTPLHTQLLNFQKEKRRFAAVVDEYGEVMGIVTLVDLLEEIVGDFSQDTIDSSEEDIKALEDGWYEIDASAFLRDINRHLSWALPTDGPKTVNGLAMEHLESIPEAPCGFEIGPYRFEIVEISGNRIGSTRVQTLA